MQPTSSGRCRRVTGVLRSLPERVHAQNFNPPEKAETVLRILPLLLVPALAAAVVYWLTRSRVAAVAASVVVLAGMLFIGVTS
jgi:hypothetical protein